MKIYFCQDELPAVTRTMKDTVQFAKRKIMTTAKLDTEALFASLEETKTALLKAIASFSEEAINTVPFKDSWTAAQVADHLAKSNESVIRSLGKDGRMPGRNADEGVAKLKGIFLDFDSKLQSPQFILPGQDTYVKQAVITRLSASFEHIIERSQTVDLHAMVDHPVFGEITKFEILHFVVYHTQRHIHQLKNIFEKVRK
jgi:hypothetical protein